MFEQPAAKHQPTESLTKQLSNYVLNMLSFKMIPLFNSLTKVYIIVVLTFSQHSDSFILICDSCWLVKRGLRS